jgi:hypothetical protein
MANPDNVQGIILPVLVLITEFVHDVPRAAVPTPASIEQDEQVPPSWRVGGSLPSERHRREQLRFPVEGRSQATQPLFGDLDPNEQSQE